MTLPAFENYDDDKLEAARLAVLTEQERRQRLAQIPDQVEQLARTYLESGGDPADLTAAVTPAE